MYSSNSSLRSLLTRNELSATTFRSLWRRLESKIIASVILLVAAFPSSLSAATITWDGGASTGAWATGTNWSTNAVPANADSLVFNATGANNQFSITLGANRTAAGITFNSAAGTNAFTFNSGSLLTINAGGIVNNDADTQTFTTAVSVGAAQTWNAASGGLTFGSGGVTLLANLTLSGANTITFGSGGGSLVNSGANRTLTNNTTGTVSIGAVSLSESATARTLTIDGSGATTVTGVIANGGAGAGGLTKIGSGTLTLSGSSTYTGTTTINAGTLAYGASNAISTGAVTVDGATAVLNMGTYTDTVGTVTLANGASITGVPGNGMLASTSSFELQSGSVSIGLNGSANLNKTTTGTVTVSGTNVYTGTTNVSAGTLIVQGTNDLGTTANTTVSSGATLTLSGGSKINKSAGTLILSGTGATGSTGALNGAAGSGGTVAWFSDIALAGNTTITGDSGLLNIGEDINSNNTFSLGANTVTFSTPLGPTVTPTYPQSPPYVLDPTNIKVSSAITGTGGLIKTGAGTLNLLAGTNGNTFTGDTTIFGGKVIVDPLANKSGLGSTNIYIGNSSSPGAANSVSLQIGQLASPPGVDNAIGIYNSSTNASASSITIYSDGLLHMNGANNGFVNITLQGGHIQEAQNTGTNTLTVTNSVTTNAASRTALIDKGNVAMNAASGFTWSVASGTTASGIDLQVDSTISSGANYTGGTGGIGFNKTGAGKMVLTGANTYTGQTNVTAGILNIQNNTALGSSTSGTTVFSGAQLQVQGGITVASESLTLNGTGISNTGALRNISGNNAYNGAVTLGAASRVNSDSGTLTMGGAITGAAQNLTVGGAGNTTVSGAIQTTTGTLTKDGIGTLTLSGSNTYSGLTTVSAGTLALGANNTIKTTNSVNVASGATLSIGNFSQTLSSISGSGLLQFGTSNALSNLSLTGTSTYSGSASGTGTLTLNAGSILTLGAGFTDANLNLILAGGTLNLNGTNNLFGNITISGNSVIDFGNGTASTLNSSSLTFASSSATLGITNWSNTVDYFYTQNFTGATPDVRGTAPANQITFSTFSNNQTVWQSYDNQVTPVPEPSTYGVCLLAFSGVFLFWHRRRTAKA